MKETNANWYDVLEREEAKKKEQEVYEHQIKKAIKRHQKREKERELKAMVKMAKAILQNNGLTPTSINLKKAGILDKAVFNLFLDHRIEGAAMWAYLEVYRLKGLLKW